MVPFLAFFYKREDLKFAGIFLDEKSGQTFKYTARGERRTSLRYLYFIY